MSQRTLLIIGGVVLAVALGLGGLVFWRMRSAAPAPVPEGQSAATPSGNGSVPETETPASEGEEAPVSRGCAERESAEACSDAERYTAAVAAKDAGQCADIGEPQARNLCVAAAAEAAGDPSQCDRITEDAIRSRCTERAVITAGDPVRCVDLGADAVESCEAAIFGEFTAPERCDGFSADIAERCRTFVDTLIAEVRRQEQRIPFAENGDEDSDGLTNALESQYGSDPLNRDTDGDGFPDGDEVNNGYSPTGPGRLETAS